MADLASNRDRHKFASKQDVVKNIIMKVRKIELKINVVDVKTEKETKNIE